MKHIVLVLGSYHPNFSAVGNCGYQIVKILNQSFRVSVISLSNKYGLAEKERFDEHDIFRVTTKDNEKRLLLNQQEKYERKIFIRINLILLKIISVLKKLVSRQTVDKKLVASYLKALHCVPEKSI